MKEAASSDRRRLLIVSATYAAAENRKKLDALASHFEVTCLTCQSAHAFGVEFKAAPTQAAKYRLVALPHWGNPGTSTRFILRGLASAMREARPEIVIVEQEPWALLRWQTYFTTRGVHPRPVFGEFSWENFVRPGIKGALLSIAYRAAIATTNIVIAGNRLGGELWKNAGLPSSRLLVAPQMGIDPSRFSPATTEQKAQLRREWNLPPARFLIGFAGRLTECKGVDQLVRAFRLLKERGHLPGAQLCLLGGGNLKPELEQLARQVDWLILPPPVDHARVADFLNCLDLFVHASRPAVDAQGETTFIEQSPFALGQAMLTALPCIGGATGAIVDIMEGLEGLIPAGDEGALESALMRCFQATPEARQAQGSANRQRVVERWTNEVIATRWAAALGALR